MNIEPSRKINFNEVKACAHQLFCYGWFRDDKCLYIGMTTQGWHRFFPHHAINSQVEVQDADVFCFWDTNNERELREMELNLIKIHRPLLNRVDKKRVETSVCLHCGVTVFKKREWQKFCSEECRVLAYKKHKSNENRMMMFTCPACKGAFTTSTLERELMAPYCPSCFLMTDKGIIWRETNAIKGSVKACCAGKCQSPYYRMDSQTEEKYNWCPECRERIWPFVESSVQSTDKTTGIDPLTLAIK